MKQIRVLFLLFLHLITIIFSNISQSFEDLFLIMFLKKSAIIILSNIEQSIMIRLMTVNQSFL